MGWRCRGQFGLGEAATDVDAARAGQLEQIPAGFAVGLTTPQQCGSVRQARDRNPVGVPE